MESTNQTSAHNKDITKQTRIRLFFGAGALVIVLGVIAFAFHAHNQATTKKSQTTAAQAAKVAITSNGFVPGTLKVRQGQLVTWTNQDTRPHHIASDIANSPTSFDSESPLGRAETYTATFDKKGTFTYHDQLNPLNSRATVIVE